MRWKAISWMGSPARAKSGSDCGDHALFCFWHGHRERDAAFLQARQAGRSDCYPLAEQEPAPSLISLSRRREAVAQSPRERALSCPGRG